MGRAAMGKGMLGCLMVFAVLAAGHTQPALPAGDADSILTPVTHEWQTEAIPRLKAFRPTVTTPIMWVEDQGEGRLIVSRGPGGILWLGREDWVYLTSFWSHTGDPQVVLVIDRKGRIYRNFEHICPSLFLQSPEGPNLNSLDAFLKTETDPGDGPPQWQLLDDSAATPDRDALPTAWEHQVQVAGSAEAPSEARQLAVLALIREGSADSWEVVEQVLEGTQDWRLLNEAQRAAASRDPARAEAIRRILGNSLGAEPAERARRLTEAILTAEDREALEYFTALAEAADKAALCTAFEAVALAQKEPVLYQFGSFAALRNSITAFGALDKDRAATFYRSLLDSANQRPRQAGVSAAGELRLADTVEKLMSLADRETGFPGAVGVALGKIGTSEAHDALLKLLLQEPIDVKQSWSILDVMAEVCGKPGGSPPGSWRNGFWATVAEDVQATAERFAQAMNQLAERTTDERLAREARARAGLIQP